MNRFAIRAFIGANGGGKTLAVLEHVVLPAWRAGRPVVANMPLHPQALGFPGSLYRPLQSWREIPELESCELVLDEISSALPSRQAQSVPPQLVRVLNQLRKTDVRCAWTAPSWARADLLLREVTQAVTVCTGKVPDRWERRQDPAKPRMFPRAARWGDPEWPIPDPPADWDSDEQRQLRAAVGLDPDAAWVAPKPGTRVEVRNGWRPNRLFCFETFDAMAYDEFTLSQATKLRPVSRRWYWRSRHAAQFAYGTLEPVGLLDHLDDVGACVVCGGHRARPKCSCPRTAPGPEAQPPTAASTEAPPVAGQDRFGRTRGVA